MYPNLLSTDKMSNYVKPDMEVLDVVLEGTSVICASAWGEDVTIYEEEI